MLISSLAFGQPDPLVTMTTDQGGFNFYGIKGPSGEPLADGCLIQIIVENSHLQLGELERLVKQKVADKTR